MSSNPGNLTSATVLGDRTDCVQAAKRLASVAPEEDLGECEYICLHKIRQNPLWL